MAAYNQFNADGVFDASEPKFTEDELLAAIDLRQRVTPSMNQPRRDHCPHTPMCEEFNDCIEAIAWYRRHQVAIEAGLRESGND